MFDQNIGQQCNNKNCNTRDYLPMMCSKDCKKAFCKECFEDHQCNEYVEIKPKIISKFTSTRIQRDAAVEGSEKLTF